jgi:hypothetical protein
MALPSKAEVLGLNREEAQPHGVEDDAGHTLPSNLP